MLGKAAGGKMVQEHFSTPHSVWDVRGLKKSLVLYELMQMFWEKPGNGKGQGRMEDASVGRKSITAPRPWELKEHFKKPKGWVIPQQEPIQWVDQSSHSCCRGQQKSKGNNKSSVRSDNFKKVREKYRNLLLFKEKMQLGVRIWYSSK